MPRTRTQIQLNPEIRVVSYNVLSSHLCDPKQFVYCDPDDCDADVRFERIIDKLQDEIKKGSIICLQEVSRLWAGKLHCYFAQVGYTLVVSCYGKAFNGYMGVGIAYPVDTFLAEDIDITRIADSRRWAKPPHPSALKHWILYFWSWIVFILTGLGLLGLIWQHCKDVKQFIWKKLNIPRKDQQVDPWEYSSWRNNTCVTITFSSLRNPNARFCIGTYHMPCAYWAPQVMSIHTSLVAQHLIKQAGGLPQILCGDWNFGPDTPCYKLLETGQMDPTSPSWPTPRSYDSWQLNLGKDNAFASAYKTINQVEPKYTNLAHTHRFGKDSGKFCETLDYIWFRTPAPATVQKEGEEEAGGEGEGKQPAVSQGPHYRLVCEDVLPIDFKPESVESYPIQEEPSDHVMIGATFSLVK